MRGNKESSFVANKRSPRKVVKEIIITLLMITYIPFIVLAVPRALGLAV